MLVKIFRRYYLLHRELLHHRVLRHLLIICMVHKVQKFRLVLVSHSRAREVIVHLPCLHRDLNRHNRGLQCRLDHSSTGQVKGTQVLGHNSSHTRIISTRINLLHKLHHHRITAVGPRVQEVLLVGLLQLLATREVILL